MNARTAETARQNGPAERPLAWPGDPETLVPETLVPGTVTAAGIDFEALAYVLANTCRFGGRTREYHSLAAHAVIASEEVEALDGLGADDRRRLALCALIADAPSAWLRGKPSSSQRSARLAAAIERVVREAAGLEPVLEEDHAELLRFVFRMTSAAESRDLADADVGAGAAFPPLRRRIRPVGPGRATRLWLARFRALGGPPRTAGAAAGITETGNTKGGAGDESDNRATEGTEGHGTEIDEGRQAA